MTNDPASATALTPQNIYDDTTFFDGYKALRDADTGLNGALEVSALRRLLPDAGSRSASAAVSAFTGVATHGMSAQMCAGPRGKRGPCSKQGA